MSHLTQVLYVVSTALLIPVILALLFMLGTVLALLGGFLRECWERRRQGGLLKETAALASSGTPTASLWEALKRAESGLAAGFCRAVGSGVSEPLRLDYAFSEVESEAAASLARLSLYVRVAPMLGLMGTLIPLGPALTALAGGNIQALSSNLVVAFATTVVGVFVSSLAYAMSLARRVWYDRDLGDLEIIRRRLGQKESPVC